VQLAPRPRSIVEVTTPAAWCEVGHRLYTLAAADTYGISHADWALRLLRPSGLGIGNGHAWGEGIKVQPPDGALLESLRNGSVHRSLVEEPVSS
jgi:hypothetical protein